MSISMTSTSGIRLFATTLGRSCRMTRPQLLGNDLRRLIHCCPKPPPLLMGNVQLRREKTGEGGVPNGVPGPELTRQQRVCLRAENL